MKNLSTYIDHTLLKPTATPADIKKLCNEAIDYGFYAVCVNGHYTGHASILLSYANVKVASVIGFPLGAMSTKAKIFEAQQCVKNGADEIDMVINIGVLKSGDYGFVQKEIEAVKNAIGENTLKIIIETCYLTVKEKKIACKLVMDAGADFVKTSTGFGTGGATIEDVKLIKGIVGDNIKIKASGGIKDAETANQYIALGVARIGTSSGINIVSNTKL